MNRNYIDLTGKKFGRLTVLGLSHIQKGRGTFFKCICECGSEKIIRGNGLKTGNTLSCGCYHKDVVRNLVFSHGESMSAEYSTWKSMKQRCLNPKANGYNNYGGRGITVCERWINSFEDFLKDMGYRPSDDLSLERINNELGYCPENCKWATSKEQSMNKRDPSQKFTFNGRTLKLSEWANELKIAYGTLYMRLKKGYPIEKTLTSHRYKSVKQSFK